ncbi:hypothetical protein M9Y10_031270 [Tritrichomonas musculus]|uniref:Uncharacterized protein n=1 Tax=Tritrichomonas musculus TaxID=1915356 RepID=A0ABR2H1F2_9EUKA
MEQNKSGNDDTNENSHSVSPGKDNTKELGDLNYTNGSGTDCGFWKHAINSKYCFQCGYFEQNADGEIFWCSYDKRTDHHKQQKGVHIHKTKKPVEYGPLDKHLRQTTTHINTRYQIYSKIAHFTATSNLSLIQGCSEELFSIIYASLDFYRHNYSQYVKTSNQQIIPKIGPEKIREIMIETADKLLDQSISKFKYARYVSICIDGGQTGARHFIDFVAWTKMSSFSIFIKDTQNLNSKGYADLALECLNHERIKEFQNKIVCFIGDGLRAQVSGFDPESNDSYHHRTGVGDLSKIMFSPCYNHRIQNSFKKTYRENILFKKMVNKVNKIAIFLRKPPQVKILKKICPEPIVTLQNTCCLSDVYPIIVAVIKQYEELRPKYQEDIYKQIINELINNIKYYTLTSPQQSIILLAYILTPQGRSAMFKSENGYLPEKKEKYISFEPIRLPDLLSKKFTENEEVNIDALIDMVTEESPNKNDDIDFLKQNDDDFELEQQNENRSVYEKCRDAISKLIKYLKININEHINLYRKLRVWINTKHDSIPFYEQIGNKEEPMAFWIEILKSEQYQEWHALADIALRLNSIAATETN